MEPIFFKCRELYDIGKLSVYIYHRISLLVGSSTLPVTYVAILYDIPQHSSCSNESKSFHCQIAPLFQEMEPPFFKKNREDLLILKKRIMSYDNGAIFTSKVCRNVTFQRFEYALHSHQIVRQHSLEGSSATIEQFFKIILQPSSPIFRKKSNPEHHG